MKARRPDQFGVHTAGIDVPDLHARRARRFLHQAFERGSSFVQTGCIGVVLVPETQEFLDLLFRRLSLRGLIDCDSRRQKNGNG
jgi:hypothetical protein